MDHSLAFHHEEEYSQLLDETYHFSTATATDQAAMPATQQKAETQDLLQDITAGLDATTLADTFAYKGSMAWQQEERDANADTHVRSNMRAEEEDIEDFDSKRLVQERDRLRWINDALEKTITHFETTQDKMTRFEKNVKTTHALMDLYVKLLSQAEHTSQLLLDGQWTADRDLEQVAAEQEAAHAERLRIEREQEEAAQKAAAEEQARSSQALALATTAQASQKKPTRGGTTGRARASRIGTTTSHRLARPVATTPDSHIPTSGTRGQMGGSLPGRGSAQVTGVRGVRGIRTRARGRGTGTGTGSGT